MKKSTTSFNEKGQRHGYWELYFSSGQLSHYGYYYNDKKIGLWISSKFNARNECKIYYI